MLLNMTCFYGIPDQQRTEGIKSVMIYVESTKDLTRVPIWEWQPEKFDFWESGRVEIPKWEEYKVRKS